MSELDSTHSRQWDSGASKLNAQSQRTRWSPCRSHSSRRAAGRSEEARCFRTRNARLNLKPPSWQAATTFRKQQRCATSLPLPHLLDCDTARPPMGIALRFSPSLKQPPRDGTQHPRMPIPQPYCPATALTPTPNPATSRLWPTLEAQSWKPNAASIASISRSTPSDLVM